MFPTIGSTRTASTPPIHSTPTGEAVSTVAAAYSELVEEGWLTSRQGSGTHVAHRAAPLDPGRRRLPERPSRLRTVHDLMPSSPDAAAFPRSSWTASARSALTGAPSEAFGVGDPRGRLELRQALAEYLARTRGVRTKAEHIVICSGFAHGLRLVCHVLRGPVAVESYGLDFHRSILTEAGLMTVPLAVDAHGARIEDLSDTGAQAVLLTPAPSAASPRVCTPSSNFPRTPSEPPSAPHAVLASPWTAWPPICTPTARCRHATAWSSAMAHHPSTRSQPPWKPSASPCPIPPRPSERGPYGPGY
ncbi:aminotransferase class I/II-fold pyridoxal phosphate-dependent enzyme [Streptosporangium canum]|uniref:aminotransferase class I/II-fold pyridoxal phosphate-dependent enzyme n=1 Tax=Streptosporangium canum TaxID=324952 RepID=UPI0034460A6D